MRRLFLIVLIVMLLVCSCVSIPADLTVTQTDDVEIIIQRGSTVGVVDNGQISFSVIGNNVLDGTGSLVIGVTNNSDAIYNFDDADVTIWGGYSENEEKWGLLGTWDANEFYDDAESEYRSQVFWTGFAGALNTLNASMGSYSNSYVRTSYGTTATVSTWSYNPGAVAAASYMAQAETNAVARSGKDYLNFLANNLLFDSMVTKNDSYVGWVYFYLNREAYTWFKVGIRNNVTNKTSYFILSVNKE